MKYFKIFGTFLFVFAVAAISFISLTSASKHESRQLVDRYVRIDVKCECGPNTWTCIRTTIPVSCIFGPMCGGCDG